MLWLGLRSSRSCDSEPSVVEAQLDRGGRCGLALEDLGVAGGDRVGEGRDLLLGAELLTERADLAALDPTGHHPLEGLQVIADVDREAVGRDTAADVDADRADLARLAHLRADAVR